MAQAVFQRPSGDPRSLLLKLAEKKKCRKCIWILVPLAILAAILLLGMKLVAGPGTLGHSSSGSDDFSPYSSLTFPISGLYCDSYTVTKYSGSPTEALESWNTSVYIMKQKPQLSSKHSFTIYGGEEHMLTLKPGEFYQWSYSLHAGSSYEINSCVWEGPEVDLYVIKGKANFNKWVQRKEKFKSYYDKTGLKRCNQSQDDISPSHKVTDGKYYFVYSSLQKLDLPSQVQVNMTFNKLEYSLNEGNVYCSHEVEYGFLSFYDPCGIPLTFHGFVLIQTTPLGLDSNISWEDTVHVSWSCNGSYKAYLLLFCVPILVLYVIGLLFSDLPKLLVCCHCGCDTKVDSCNLPKSAWICCKGSIMWFLRIILVLLCSLTFLFILVPIVLKIFNAVAKYIPGLHINDLKLGLLALGALLFVVAFFCNKLKGWVQSKVDDLNERSGRSFCNASSDTIFHLYMIIFAITMCVTLIGFFTFLEGFYPILSEYVSDTDYDVYSAGKSSEFSFNSFWCSGYSIRGYGSPHLSARLHIFEPSSLVQTHSLSHINSTETISAGDGSTWNLYLSSSSSANITICIIYKYFMQYAVLQVTPYDSNGIAGDSTFYPVLDFCDSDDPDPIPIKEREKGPAGYYFLWLSTNINDSLNLNVDITLDRYKYSFKSDANNTTSSKQTCSITPHTTDSCSVTTQSTAGHWSWSGLIQVDRESNDSYVDWYETLSIRKTCNYHWATWTALWLPVLLINTACCSVICVGMQVALCRAGRTKKSPKKRKIKTDDSNSGTETGSLLCNPTTNGYGATVAVTNRRDTIRGSEPGTAHITQHSTDQQAVVVEAEVEPELDVVPKSSPSGSVSRSVEIGSVSSQPTSLAHSPLSISIHDGVVINCDIENGASDEGAPLLKPQRLD